MKPFNFTLPVMILAIGTTLTGCGNDEPKTNQNEKSESESKPTANKLDEYISPLDDSAPVYKVGISAGYAPFEFKNEFGKVIGYDVDIVRAIGEEAGFKVEFYDIPFSNLQSSLEEGKYDFGMSSSFKESDSFIASNPYIRSQTAYIVRSDSPIKSEDDIKNKNITVSVQANTDLEQRLKNASLDVLSTKTIFLAFQDLFSNHSSAVFGEEPILIYNSSQFPDIPMRIITTDYDEKHRVIVSAVENKQEIINLVNKGLEKIKTTGKYQKINEKWFGEHVSDVTIN